MDTKLHAQLFFFFFNQRILGEGNLYPSSGTYTNLEMKLIVHGTIFLEDRTYRRIDHQTF